MNTIKEHRTAQRMTRRQLADAAGITDRYVGHMERQERPGIRLEVARRLADALDTTLDDLFPGTTRRGTLEKK